MTEPQAMDHSGKVALTPYVPTLFGEVEEAVRQLLGLTSNVIITRRPSPRGSGSVFDFRVLLPNGVEIDMRLADPAEKEHAFVQSERLKLVLLNRQGGDPRNDPAAAPSVDALGRLFRAHQRKNGAALTEALWRAYEPVAPWVELDDSYFCKVFRGVRGTSATLRLGFGCNQDCHFCWQARKWPEPPAELYQQWLHELGAAGIGELIVTGGEPTLHKALPELLAVAKEQYGMFTMLQTNAIALRRPAFVERLRVDRIFVSFHAADAAISDHMTRALGTHNNTVAGIASALAAGKRIGLNCVVEQSNYRHLAAHAAFIVERFVKPFPARPIESVTYSRPQTYYDNELFRDSLVPADELTPGLLAAATTLRQAGVLVEMTSGSCGLAPCIFRSMPELIELPEPEHVGMADPGFRRPAGGACARCALNDRCQGPGHGYSERFGDRGLVPFTHVPRELASPAKRTAQL